MDRPSNFTFIETADLSSKSTITNGSAAKSLIRSHAMQQVWEQRRLKRLRNSQHNESSPDLENERLERTGKSKLEVRRSLSESQQPRGNGEPTKKRASWRALRPNLADGAVECEKPKQWNDLPKVPPNDRSEAPHKSSGWSSSVHMKRRDPSNGHALERFSSEARSISPSTIDVCLMDPFETCSLPLGVRGSRYMNHYFQTLSWRLTMPKKTWLRYAIHDPGLLSGVLAIAAAHYSFANSQTLSDDATYHHGMTISHVQTCLANPSLRFSDGVIGAIGRMALCHLVFGNRWHFIAHLKALDRIVAARGGFQSLGMMGQLKHIIASCACGASSIWWDDVPDGVRYPYGLLDYSAVKDIPDAEPYDPENGSALRELHRTGFLPDTFLDICQGILALNSVLSSRREWTEPQQRDFGEQCNKLSLRLAYFRKDEIRHQQEESPERLMRECMRMVAHYYVICFQRDVPILSKLSIHSLQTLTEALARTDLDACWGGGLLGEACLWVLVISGAGCFRPQDRACAGATIRKTAAQLGITEWPEVQRICRKFVYLDSELNQKTWPLWKGSEGQPG